jgi:23S rRNA-/tRNA-specific pseudouridylate synthase
VIGKPEENGEINTPVDGKEALTKFKTLKTIVSKKYGHLSLLELIPVTGRTHQLRIHCHGSGYPILGDKLYFKENFLLKGKGLFLFAGYLSFFHPHLKKTVEFKKEMPNKFKKYMTTDE